MSYPYPHYNGEDDAEAHIRAYLTTLQANHASKRLELIEANISKLADVRTSTEIEKSLVLKEMNISTKR